MILCKASTIDQDKTSSGPNQIRARWYLMLACLTQDWNQAWPSTTIA